jgi:hypothetical protein
MELGISAVTERERERERDMCYSWATPLGGHLGEIEQVREKSKIQGRAALSIAIICLAGEQDPKMHLYTVNEFMILKNIQFD